MHEDVLGGYSLNNKSNVEVDFVLAREYHHGASHDIVSHATDPCLLDKGGDVSALDIECNGNLETLVASLAAHSPLYTIVREEKVSGGIDVCVSERVLDDAKSMGLLNENFEVNCELVSCSNKELSWEESVDLANGFHKPKFLVRDDEVEHQSFFLS
ncbi:hypothetical protein V6N13_148344 [Hibiscus sabdariffa]|uniref:Uncharacterized protein n=1 Tax=Hibiscus sabdariffa TaxID=183260 RepID=A0ABR2TYM1_9ROSI